VLPLLAIYEIGVTVSGAGTPEELRNGADSWLRAGLASFGVSSAYAAPACWFCLLLWAGAA